MEHTSILFQQYIGVLKCVDLAKVKTAIIIMFKVAKKIKPHVPVYGTRQNDSLCITRFRTNAKSM